MEIIATPILTTSSKHGEGALWDVKTGKLLWVDIDGYKVNRFDPATGANASWATPTACGTVVPRRGGGAVAVALADGFASVDLASGRLEYLQKMSLGDARFNDGKCDPAGRFWAGTMARKAAAGAAVLYRLDPDLSLHTMLTGVTISNGLVWSRDARTMYYIDTPTGQVDAFDYSNETGAITNRRAAFKIDTAALGHPDGMAIDDRDRLWIAMWGGARVCCFDPRTGSVLLTVRTPGSKHSSACALGGPNLDELWITTSAQGITPEERAPGGSQPHAGRLFHAKVPATGVPASEYAG